MLEKLKGIKIGPMPLLYYIPVFIILAVAVYTGNLNDDIVGTIAFLAIVGWILEFIGEHLPILGTWCGAGTLLPLFGGAAIATFQLVPDTVISQASDFMGSGFINVFLSAIIVGSILGMDRKLLLNTAVKVIPCFLGAIVFVFLFLAIGCVLTGQSILDGLFMVGITSYGGGSSGSIAVIPQIYSPLFGEPVGFYAGKFLVFLNISNVICVVLASLLGKFGNSHPKLTGHGKLMKGDVVVESSGSKEPQDIKKNITKLGVGMALATTFMIAGNLIAAVLPQLNYIAWATILVIIVKALGIMSDEMCEAASIWQQFIVRNFISFLVFGIGISSLDLGELVSYLTFANVFIIFLGVVGSIVGSGLVGKLVGFYPIESMIGIGCCMGNTGGSGALQVLSATDRMELMPFSVISNRLGGAIDIVIISLVVPMLV